MWPDRVSNRDLWLLSQTCYRLRYAARPLYVCVYYHNTHYMRVVRGWHVLHGGGGGGGRGDSLQLKNGKIGWGTYTLYRKNSKNWDTLNYYRDCPTNGIVGFYSAIFRSKDADRITNRVDTDQTAP